MDTCLGPFIPVWTMDPYIGPLTPQRTLDPYPSQVNFPERASGLFYCNCRGVGGFLIRRRYQQLYMKGFIRDYGDESTDLWFCLDGEIYFLSDL